MPEKLEACVVCHHQVAANAAKCPGCGASFPAPTFRRNNKRFVVVFFIVPIFIFGGCIAAMLIGGGSSGAPISRLAAKNAIQENGAPRGEPAAPIAVTRIEKREARDAFCTEVAKSDAQVSGGGLEIPEEALVGLTVMRLRKSHPLDGSGIVDWPEVLSQTLPGRFGDDTQFCADAAIEAANPAPEE